MTSTPTEPVTVYVAMVNARPTGVSGHLGHVKAHARSHASAYHRHLRWEETRTGVEWQLMSLNVHTQRWHETGIAVHAAPIVDTPATGTAQALRMIRATAASNS